MSVIAIYILAKLVTFICRKVSNSSVQVRIYPTMIIQDTSVLPCHARSVANRQVA